MPPPPNWQGPGGKHEFGAWWGLSVMSGHIWGYAGDVKYMPIDLRYSYEFYRHHESWTMRYSPETDGTGHAGLANAEHDYDGNGVQPARARVWQRR